jgi:peptide/nickel transport system substrate-binding protein
MSRARSRPARLLAAGVALTLVIGCGEPPVTPSPTTSRSASGAPSLDAMPSAAPSSGPFVPMAYPADGPAPCEQPTSDDPAHGPYAGSLARIVAKDARTVVFQLCDRDPAFLIKVASPTLAIDDTAWLQTHLDRSADRQPIFTEVDGTGPFRVDGWDGTGDIALSRFDGYWGTPPLTSAVVFVAEGDAGRRLSKLQEGSVDGVDVIAPGDLEAVRADPELTPLPRDGLNVAYIGINSRFAPFDNEVVRRALALGIDRSAIVGAAFPAGSEVAGHFLPCAIPYACGGAAFPEPDAAAGRDLLAEAGFPEGFQTTITYSDIPRDYLPDPSATASALQVQLHDQLGITATLKVMPFDELTAAADSGRLAGLYLLGARARYPDPRPLLEGHFGPSASLQFGRRYDDIARMLARGRSTSDPKVRADGYSRVNGLLAAHVPMIPLAHVGTTAAYRADVRGAEASATATERFAAVTPGDRRQFVFMQHDRPASLFCADETADEALRVCAQVSEALYRPDLSPSGVAPSLAERCTPSKDLMTWTCTLRAGVRFHDGAELDANDVVLSFALRWDLEHPLHVGRDGLFQGFIDRFGGFLHPRPAP